MAPLDCTRRLTRARAWLAPASVLTVSLVAVLAALPGKAAEGGIALVPGALPNYVGFGIGVANDYVGSDDLALGGLPLARLSWENRYVTLEGNYLAANVVNHPV